MAIVPQNEYSGQIDTGDAGYPLGRARNVSASGDGTGTPLEKAWVNDIWGLLQSLLDRAGATPTGSPDEVGASQYMDVLNAMVGSASRDVVRASYMLRDAPIASDTHTTSSAKSVAYNDDGTRIFILQEVGGTRYVTQANLSTPWDLSTAVEQTPLDIGAQVATPRSLKFKPDGTRFWVLDAADGDIHQYDCSTPWQTTSGVSYDTAWTTPTAAAEDFHWYDSGDRVAIVTNTNSVFSYSFTSAYDAGSTESDGGNDLLTGWEPDSTACYWIAMAGADLTVFFGLYNASELDFMVFEAPMVTPIYSAGGLPGYRQGTSMHLGHVHRCLSTLTKVQFSPDGSRAICANFDGTTVYQFLTTRLYEK